jgi:hypothetical protein
MSYGGDIRLGDTIDVKFTTRTFTTGAPGTLSSSPVISAYVGNSTTQITAGITLSVDFDGVTGLNNVRVVASGGNGFATASNYQLVITTGTVGGVSVVGEVIAEFSIEARSAIMPTTAARTLDVSAGGGAGLDWANVKSPTTTVALTGTTTAATDAGIIDSGTAQSATGTTLVLRSAAAFASSEIVGSVIVITGGTTGVGQSRIITAYNGGTDTATVDTWTTTPTGTITYNVFAAPPASTTLIPAVNTTQFAGQTVTAAAGVTLPSSVASPTNITAGTITTVTNLTNAATAGDFTATMKTSIGTAVAASAVASVTGNVGGSVASVTAGVTVTTNNDKTGYALTSAYDFAKGTTAMTEAYAANGVAPTPVQAMFAMHQMLMQFGIASTNYTVKKLDNTTTAFVVTLDSATTPTAASRV